MKQWQMVIDVELCENCNNCVLAAKDEYVGNAFPGYSAPQPPQGKGVISIERKVRGEGIHIDAAYLPKTCNHCADAPCVKAAPDAIRQRPDGIVIIDPVKARGRPEIVASCPYGVIIWNEAEQVPQNYIFDAHLLDQGWEAPRAVQVCPTSAITTSKATAAEMAERVAREDLVVLAPELRTQPRVYYRNMHRFAANFIAGSVVAMMAGVLECADQVEVTLAQAGKLLARTKTNGFGDFKFDRLAPGSGAYRLEFVHPAHGTAELEAVMAGDSIALPDIMLETSE